MKKIFIFLITAFCFYSASALEEVSAKDSFYESSYISGINMAREKDGTTNYQTARFFRHSVTKYPAYCIEPFKLFNADALYTKKDHTSNFTKEQLEEISLLAYFGYGNKKSDTKWYAITQLMIWKIGDPTGNYYFTDGFKGPKINIFTAEMNELQNLVDSYKVNPSFHNKAYSIIEGESLTINDSNNVLNSYQVTSNNAIIDNNKLVLNNLKPGKHTITLKHTPSDYNRDLFYYEANNSQNLVTAGNMKPKYTSLTIYVEETNLSIKKIDKDTGNFNSLGEGSLIGTTFHLYTSNNEFINEIIINDENLINIENLSYGEYYLKEIKAGTGYILNKDPIYFSITKENPNINLIIENEIIKKELIITKYFGTENNFSKEKNISFEIYDINNNLIDTITTDINGVAKIILPYGTYTIKQLNTTDGYYYAEIPTIIVNNNEVQNLDLYDYKVEVPDTSKIKTSSLSFVSLIIFIGFTYARKKYITNSYNN